VHPLKEARIIIVGWKPNSSQFLRSMLSTLGRPAFTRVAGTEEALALLRERGFELVFCTDECEPHSASAFARAARRDQYSRQPTIPIVIISKGATLAEFDELRAAGVDDIMCPPLSADQIEKRLHRILLRPRDFVVCKAFIGPDRRRTPGRTFAGQNRRTEALSLFQLPPVAGRTDTIPVIEGPGGPAQDIYICDT